ncbi:hypothetical protein GMSM_18910 [Geomonas sp. Red276]
MNFDAIGTRNPFTSFYLKLCFLISLVIILLYAGFYVRNAALLDAAVKQQARAYLSLILKVRRWNANYGGVYVEKKDGVETNRFLKEMGVGAELATTDGKLLTLKNPFLMTYEISKISNQDVGITYHITSLRLVDQQNAPDRFEYDSLKKFEAGETEAWSLEKGSTGPVLRFMAPLIIEKPCLKCHSNMNYRLGDVRGGICINIPYQDAQHNLVVNRVWLISLSVGTLLLLLGSAYLMLNRLGIKLDLAQKSLQEAAITDELTGLHNRRFFISRFEEEVSRSRRDGLRLGLMMIDLDDFKLINDGCGHPFGDLVLSTTAKALAANLRDYDVAARYGGEEFAFLIPLISEEDLVALAERIASSIANIQFRHEDQIVRVTASIGATLIRSEDTCESMMKRADDGLYRAKTEGKNKIVFV